MTLRECYEQIGGNYEDVQKRLCSDALIQKFLGKFLLDKSYAGVRQGLREDLPEEAFRAAHTLKGVCQNLGLGRLSESSAAVTEALRGGENHVTKEQLEQLEKDYEITVAAIRALLG